MARKSKARKAPARRAAPEPKAPPLLLYKVVELSNVDESSLEDTVNTWVRKGWTFDGVQFAMRESSKRPSMGFVFFTRPGTEEDERRTRDLDDADRKLRRLAAEPIELVTEPVTIPASEGPTRPVSAAWERLAELADDSDSD
jgi:hypothetical protein